MHGFVTFVRLCKLNVVSYHIGMIVNSGYIPNNSDYLWLPQCRAPIELDKLCAAVCFPSCHFFMAGTQGTISIPSTLFHTTPEEALVNYFFGGGDYGCMISLNFL